MSSGAPRILIQDTLGVRQLEEGYASENELQTFLRDYAELMPMDDLGSTTRPLLCIGFEVNVSAGSQDLLYIDPHGALTIVETKLKRNPGVRREVVGQILEYAADAVLWSQSDIEDRASRFFSSNDCQNDFRNLSLKEAYNRFRDERGVSATDRLPYEAFAEEMRSNLERGNIRLIIAVDEIHPALLRTIEFVNRFSERFEMYLFQLKRFHDSATEANIFVPALFGRIPDAVAEGKRRRLWNRDRFLDQIMQTKPSSRDLFERLISLCEEHNAISWGRGATWGTFGFHVPGKEGTTAPAFGGDGGGTILLDFRTLGQRLDIDLVEQFRDALRRVTAIPPEVVGTATWRYFDATCLADEHAYNVFVEAVLLLSTAAAARHTKQS